MRLEGNLYTLNERFKTEDGIVIFRITLRKESDIYKGHFPGHPITPGAAIVKLAEELIGKKINKLTNVKFLIPIIPEDSTILEFAFKIKDKKESGTKYEISVCGQSQCFAKLNIITEND